MVNMLKVALPKGRMQEQVLQLLADAGVRVRVDERGYRPTISLERCEAKILKPQSIVQMLHVGARDIGFAGADWVAELGAAEGPRGLVPLMDTGLDPVRVVVAAPESILVDGALPQRPLVVASEYEQLTRRWIAQRGLDATFLRSYGATEVFPPEDADVIVDNCATGSTLRANHLAIVDEVMQSSTRLFANPVALDDPDKRRRIEDLVLLLRSVLEARHRVILEVNVSAADLEGLVAVLPCMRHPTISRLHGEDGYAVKAAVPRADLPRLIPLLRARGGSDIIVARLAQIVP
ncbi:MAG: ATP phosphoribosyltransferase [Deltaproteobacteria bacterium]|nr:ATP phosphoribosyltransferase [Deltaproteobacteria bacterium]